MIPSSVGKYARYAFWGKCVISVNIYLKCESEMKWTLYQQ